MNATSTAALIPSAAALQSLTMGAAEVPATARTRRCAVVDGSTAARWPVPVTRSTSAEAKSSESLTCTSYASASGTASQVHSMKSVPVSETRGIGAASTSGAARVVPDTASLQSLRVSALVARTRTWPVVSAATVNRCVVPVTFAAVTELKSAARRLNWTS